WNPPGSIPDYMTATQTAARSLGVTLQAVEVRTAADFGGAFASILKQRAEALVVGPGQFLFSHQRRVVEFSATNHLPSIYAWKDPVIAGGLMAYGINIPQAYRRARDFVDNNLGGGNSGGLPRGRTPKYHLPTTPHNPR